VKFDITKLAAMGFTPQQINLLLDQNHQRKVKGSNVVLSPDEIKIHTLRSKMKTYAGRCEIPLPARVASKIERKFGLNKNMTDKQVQDTIDKVNGKVKE